MTALWFTCHGLSLMGCAEARASCQADLPDHRDSYKGLPFPCEAPPGRRLTDSPKRTFGDQELIPDGRIGTTSSMPHSAVGWFGFRSRVIHHSTWETCRRPWPQRAEGLVSHTCRSLSGNLLPQPATKTGEKHRKAPTLGLCRSRRFWCSYRVTRYGLHVVAFL